MKRSPWAASLRFIEHFPRLRAAVIGDFAADHYLVGKTSRISREAPVLILKKLEDSVRPGQAGNSAANLAALGARCTVLGVTGGDAHGRGLAASLRAAGVDAAGLVAAPKARTLVKTRVLAGAHHTGLQQVVRLDDDEGLEISASVRRKLHDAARRMLPELDAVLVSDYGYGTVDPDLWGMLAEEDRRRRASGGSLLRVLDSRHALGVFREADVITPNETEVFAHLGIEKFAGADPAEAGRRLVESSGCKGLVMTRGNEGMLIFDGRRKPEPLPIHGTDEVTDVTGAGDTVAAWVTAARASGASLVEAARLATIAAGVKVMKRGAAAIRPDEVRAAAGAS